MNLHITFPPPSLTPALDRVLGLPELLPLIAVHLRPPTLAACARVSRLWNEAFTPALWHTIDDDDYNWPKLVDSGGKYDEEAGS